MSTTYEIGEWVLVWGQVVETDPHPEEITVRMESHNEDYRCLVRRDRVVRAHQPDFAPRCGSLFQAGDHSGLLHRCDRVSGHDRDGHREGQRAWTEDEAAGWMEEQ